MQKRTSLTRFLRIASLVAIFGAMLPAQTSAAPSAQEVSPLADQTWVKLGGPIGGLGYDIRMRPDNPDIMYVTDANAGVYFSDNGGKTWEARNEGINMRLGATGDIVPVFSLTIDPNNPNIIWVGLQGLSGIYRSIDGGLSWEKRTTGIVENQGITFRGFSVEPGNSDTVYAAAEISPQRWAGRQQKGRQFDMTKGVVYKSIDSGEHWTAIWRGDNLARYIWIDPRNYDVLYVSTGIFDREAANTNVDTNEPGGVGVIKSTDGGQTWDTLDAEEGLTGLYVGSLFMNPENPDILLAGAGHDYWSAAYDQGGLEISPDGVFLTEDGGATWTKTLGNIQIYSVEYCLGNQETAYAAGPFAVYRSEDSGHTWKRMSGSGVTYGEYWGPPGIVAGFPIDIQCDPRDPDRLFVNNYGGGNFLSEDGGKTWVDSSRGYSGAMVFGGLALDVDNPSTIYAGARSGLFRSADGGLNWSGLAYSPANASEITTVGISPVESNTVISSPWDIQKLVLSDTGGRNWKLLTGLNTEYQTGQLPVDLKYSLSNPEIIYVAIASPKCIYMKFDQCNDFGKGIYVTRDGGTSWTDINDDQTRSLNAVSMAVNPVDPNVVFVAALKGGVYKTINGGETWQKLSLNCEAWSVAINPMDYENIFVGCNGGIRVSSDEGLSWVFPGSGMPPESLISAIAIDPSNPAIIWSSDYFSGVYLSVNGGKTWQQFNDGLTNRTVLDLAISSDGQTLFAATQGGGVFRLSTHDQAFFDSLAPTPTPTSAPTSTVPTATPIPPSAVQPTAPAPAPTATPKPAGGGGLCGGAAIPLALVGLHWLKRRK